MESINQLEKLRKAMQQGVLFIPALVGVAIGLELILNAFISGRETFLIHHAIMEILLALVLLGIAVFIFFKQKCNIDKFDKLYKQKIGEAQRNILDINMHRYALDQSALVVVTDTQGKIEYANEKFCLTSGYSLAELVGQNPRLFKSGLNSKDFYKRMWDTMLSGNIWKHEICNLTKTGEPFWLSTTIVPFKDLSGQVVRFLGIHFDISEIKKIQIDLAEAKEQAQQATVAKSEFLANMSHEIRTPMNALVGMIDLLLLSQLSAEQRDYLSTMKYSSKILLSIINDILDLSKVEAGKLELEHTPFLLDECFNNLIRLMSSKAQEHGLFLRIEKGEDIPNNLIGDGMRLAQVLTNLLSNAIKFTHNGEVVLKITKVKLDDKTIDLCIAVCDTGIGISEEQAATLFQPFAQATADTSRLYGGTGLGLAISRKLVTLMGGEIKLVSNKGVGSEFSVYLTFPLAKEQLLPSAVLDKQEMQKILTNDFAKSHPLTICIAEDNIANQKLLSAFLRRMGYEATIVENGQLLVDLLEKTYFDLILTDMRMPEMDGDKAAQLLLARFGKDRPYIIAVTANSSELKAVEYFDDAVYKPIDVAELHLAITKCQRKNIGNINARLMLLLAELGDDKETVIQIIDAFCASAKKIVDSINNFSIETIGDGERADLHRLAHTLAGSARNLGAIELSIWGEHLEEDTHKSESKAALAFDKEELSVLFNDACNAFDLCKKRMSM